MSFGILLLVVSGLIRILTTILIAFGDQLNWKERVRIIIDISNNKLELNEFTFLFMKTFVALSWMAKATVQAALGPVALNHLAEGHEEIVHAEVVLMVCILAIVVTAPLGAILISITGTKLLTKTSKPSSLEPESELNIFYHPLVD